MNEQVFKVTVKSNDCTIAPELINGTLLQYAQKWEFHIEVDCKELEKKEEDE